MSAPKTILWAMDDHTRAKHEILRRYLDAWLPIMTTYNWVYYLSRWVCWAW